ncbi:helix-turn-helix domain-containing protein [Altererythrobacter sp. GH1-8]|uniref:AraC family transcriptional regulator n=1 Tax=Altererythrobacter sp. GH1-8 TaxID=3349333 RepID=UPI00374CFCF6
MVESIDIALRFIAIGSSLLLLILLLAGAVRTSIKVPLAGLLLGAMAYLLNSSPAIREFLPLFRFADLLSLTVPFWLWLFARRLFEKEPDRGLFWALVAIQLICWYFGSFQPWSRPVGFYVIHLVGLALVIDLIRVAIADLDDDLIEKRRMIRLWLPIFVGLQSGGVLIFEMVQGQALSIAWVQMVNAGLIVLLTLFAGLALLTPDPELLVQSSDSPVPTPSAKNALSTSELVLKEKLDGLMAERFYRTPGLTIAGLADHLEVPEHRLRALINKGLGHRNFSAFLNGHRIAEARAILADKAKVDVPVLTIAMDLGYNSLATFNRAFRAESGTTPSDYRREKIGQILDQN